MQFGILFLFAGSNYFGWKVLTGNYSSALLLGKIHLTDPFAVLQILFSGFVVAIDAIIGALVILLFYSLVAGRAFCSWVCPLNTIIDFAGWLNEKFKIQSRKNSESFPKLRYYILLLSLILSVVLGLAAFETISPIGILHRSLVFGLGSGLIVVGAIFLFDLFARPISFCTHICPLGAFYSIVGRFRVLKVKHILDNCTNCNKCFRVCPEEQVLEIIGKENGRIASGECNNCGRCIEVCIDKALKFSIIKK